MLFRICISKRYLCCYISISFTEVERLLSVIEDDSVSALHVFVQARTKGLPLMTSCF